MKPQLLIGSPTSGSGKTTVTSGLLRLMKRRGVGVQPFKCGADSFDTFFHSIAGGQDSVNLDTWLASRTHVQYVYNMYAEWADMCVTDGSMGLFDGYGRMKGSGAEMALLLNIPVVMVVNARTTGYSAAPILYGFKHFRPSPRIAGVIFNQITSKAHFSMMREACMDAGIDCLGYVPYIDDLHSPGRHSALTAEARKLIDNSIDRVADAMEQFVDVDKMLGLCTGTFPCAYQLPYRSSEVEVEPMRASGWKKPVIAVARDSAFCFLYKENLDRLSEMGRVSFFSPVYSNSLPEADLIYLPDGYPELFARQIHRRKQLLGQLKAYAEAGGKILAEGGGMALLGRSLSVKPEGMAYEMANVLPFDFVCAQKPAVGYRKTIHNETKLRGYECHYSFATEPMDTPLWRYQNVIAGYARWYWGETDLMNLWRPIP